MGKGEATRERILEIAEAAVLAKGFGATSIDEVITEAGLTKSGFFYHFKDKNALAHEMLRRYVATNDRLFDEIFARGGELSDDPLQAFLISLKLLAETMAGTGARPSAGTEVDTMSKLRARRPTRKSIARKHTPRGARRRTFDRHASRA